jgi:hypothetical protein
MQEISLDYIAEQYKKYKIHMKWYNKSKKTPTFKILTFMEFVELNYKGKYHII